jgi:hypothetical protein
MKMFIAALAVSSVSFTAVAIDSIRFTEQIRDAAYCVVDEGERFCEVVTIDGGSINARVTIPGLGALALGPNTLLRVTLGNMDIQFTLREANTTNANGGTLFITYEDNNGHERRIGQVSFSRAGDVLTVNAASSILSDTIIDFADIGPALVSRTLNLTVRVGTLFYQRRIYYTARTTQRPPPDAYSDPLLTTVASGKADFTPPTVVIKNPRNRSRSGNETVTVSGTARDNIGLSQVLYRLGTNNWFAATGTSNWTAMVTLPVGTNVVQVKSVDLEGQESRVMSRTLIRTP